jgi:phosphoribosylanthranilate isomerase
MKPVLKFCGHRSYDDYRLAAESRADYIGFVFYRGSQRYVTPSDVGAWTRLVPPGAKQRLVGVFVRPDLSDIAAALRYVDLSVIQLHGDESPAFTKKVKALFRKTVWKAIHHGEGEWRRMAAYEGAADGYIIDRKIVDQWGGTGAAFDWRYVPQYVEEAHRQGALCLIAGGVTNENIERLLAYRPDGVDVASGIERDGAKVAALMREMERKVEGHHA